MRDPVLIIWRRRPDVAIFDVEASPNGSPRLIQAHQLDPDLAILESEQQLLNYLAEGRVERVAVTYSVARDVLGWDL